LPEFKIADLSKDIKILKYVQEKAIEILQDDKKLEKEENFKLKNCIKEKFSKVEL